MALEEAKQAAIRWEENFDIPVTARSKGFVVAVVRGERRLDDVLPYMSTQPFAFTNPIWFQRE